jgi:hypothetical protein
MRIHDNQHQTRRLLADLNRRSAARKAEMSQLSKSRAMRVAAVIGVIFLTVSLVLTVRTELFRGGTFDLHATLHWRSRGASLAAVPAVVSKNAGRACALSSGATEALRRHGAGDSENISVPTTPQDRSANPKSLSASNWTRHLDAGQSATFGSDGVIVETVGRREMERRVAWAKKVLDLDGTLSDAVAEFNRYNVRKIQIAGENLKHTRISGRFEATDPWSFIEALSHLGITHSVVSPDAPVDVPILLSQR